MTDSSTISVQPTDVWHRLQTQPKSPIQNLINARALAALLRRALSDETPIQFGVDAHEMEVCVLMLEKQLEKLFARLEASLSEMPAA